jgi:hypothetical protein
MATVNLRLVGYEVLVEPGRIKFHLVADPPQPPYPQSDFYVTADVAEVPANMSGAQLKSLIQARLDQAYGGVYNASTNTGGGIAPINTALAAGGANLNFAVTVT